MMDINTHMYDETQLMFLFYCAGELINVVHKQAEHFLFVLVIKCYNAWICIYIHQWTYNAASEKAVSECMYIDKICF